MLMTGETLSTEKRDSDAGGMRGGRVQPMHHVCRRASIGSSLAARIAGYHPKNTPISPETKTASATDDGSTSNGQPVPRLGNP